MNPNDLPEDLSRAAENLNGDGVELLTPLLRGATHGSAMQEASIIINGVVIGELLALSGDGATPLVRFSGDVGVNAVAAQSSVDLHAAHIGRRVVLMFEHGDPSRPIVIGVLIGAAGWPLAEVPAQVEVDADGQRMIVKAKEQLVLRCGKASITLTRTGKVLIEGTYVASLSDGVNRIKGGSVHLN